MEDFVDWLTQELRERGWSRSEAARRGGISASMFDKVINRDLNPGVDFCTGVAQAFSMFPDEVFRRAGILPPKPKRDAIIDKIMYYLDQLSEEDRDRAVLILEALANRPRSEAQDTEHAGQSLKPATS